MKETHSMPATLAKQQDVLVAVNELLVAVDIARRAESHSTLLDAVSLCTQAISPLFLYRTVPRVCLGASVKMLMALEAVPAEVDGGLFGPQTRALTSYILHHCFVMCTQLRYPNVLVQMLKHDVPERYVAKQAVETIQKLQAVADVTQELASVGNWEAAAARWALLEPEGDVRQPVLKQTVEDPLGALAAAKGLLLEPEGDVRQPV